MGEGGLAGRLLDPGSHFRRPWQIGWLHSRQYRPLTFGMDDERPLHLTDTLSEWGSVSEFLGCVSQRGECVSDRDSRALGSARVAVSAAR